MLNNSYHTPVLLTQSVDLLGIKPDGIYVDVTFGGGGHSAEILSRLGKKGRLVSFDQDADAIANAPKDDRFTLVHNNFMYIRSCLRACGIEEVDGVLADLGVSSHHFDTPERGFSFRFDAPLDMRMNQKAVRSAADVVNTYSLEEMARVFGAYGELEKPMRMASDIIKAREIEPITTIAQLQEAVKKSTPQFGESKFYAKLFQALRIEVNKEMLALEMMLEGAKKILKPGGVLSVITYHSLEDRMVKNFLRSGNIEGNITKDFFGVADKAFDLITRKAIEPTAEEIQLNSRARSAKLRAGAKI